MQAVLQQFYGPLPSRKRRHTAETAAVQMLREEVAQVQCGVSSVELTGHESLLKGLMEELFG